MVLVMGGVKPNTERVTALRYQATRWQATGNIRKAEALDAAADLLEIHDATGIDLHAHDATALRAFVNGLLADLGMGPLR